MDERTQNLSMDAAMPRAEVAEQYVIRACLVDPDGMVRAKDVGLEADHFMGHKEQLIYAAAERIFKAGKMPDYGLLVTALSEQLLPDGTALDAIGGIGELTRYIGLDSFMGTSQVVAYAELIMKAWHQRRVIQFASTVAAKAFTWKGSANDLTLDVEKMLGSLYLEAEDDSTQTTNDEYWMNFIEEQERMADLLAKDKGYMLTTPWPSLNAMLGQLRRGALHLVLAPTSVGKTMYLEALAEWNASRGRHVLFYESELTIRELRLRQICRYSMANFAAMDKGQSTGNGIWEAIEHIRKWQGSVTYIYCPGWSMERIATDIKRHAMRGPVDMAIYDYLQMLPLQGRFVAHELGMVTNQFKIACAQHNIAGVLSSQVRRKDDRGGGRVTLNDLRNSGEPVEKANQVVVLERVEEDARRDHQASELVKIWVDKNSNMPLGQVAVRHVFGRFRFEDRGAIGEGAAQDWHDREEDDDLGGEAETFWEGAKHSTRQRF